MREILFTESAKRDLLSLERSVRTRITTKLRFFASEPLKYARKLSQPAIGSYRFRIGDYRVIFDLEGDTIVVLRLGHRREIYGS